MRLNEDYFTRKAKKKGVDMRGKGDTNDQSAEDNGFKKGDKV
jgi:hypothetical protein